MSKAEVENLRGNEDAMAHLRTLVLVLWWPAVSSLSGVTSMAANLALHAIGIAVLLLVLLVPSLGRGVDRRLAGHLRHGT
jgi:hypothetical protein